MNHSKPRRDRVAAYLAKKPQGDIRHARINGWAQDAAKLPSPADLYVPQGEGHTRRMNESLRVLVPWINEWNAEWTRRGRAS